MAGGTETAVRQDPEIVAIFDYIASQFDAHVERLREFVRQPSISAEDVGVRDCAKLLRRYFEELGCAPAEVVETDGHPVVYGERWVGAARTLVIYLMYDTQPFVGESWSVLPLDGQIVHIEPFGRCMVARGVKNSKGPLRAFLNAVAAIQAVTNTLPLNLIFVAEGEEELGSVHLPQFIAQYASRLLLADAVLFPYALQETDGRAPIWPGTKGLLYVELEASGRRWGRGPREYDIHASQKAIVDSPAWRLIKALSTLVSDDGNTVMLDGFFDMVREPTLAEAEAAERLGQTFNLDSFRTLWKVDTFVDAADMSDLIGRYFFSPTLNIDGIWGGYIGPGSKTVLPTNVTAKLDARFVPNQRKEELVDKLRQHLDRRGYQDIELRVLGGGESSQTPPDALIVRAAAAGYRDLGIEPEIWPRNVGFFPAYLFTDPPLSLPFCNAGLGHGGRAHSPDEYLVLDGNERVLGLTGLEQTYVAILYRYASLASEPNA